ncbi:hypothetical protein [Vibrio profundi]|uniref:hypothetical protein n=1 Tax=Vibrio profundi TaxID=1774960 RepID=UPI003734DA70
MKANPHPDLALPNEVWAGKQKNIVLGSKIIELHYVGMSHGLGMTVSLLPKEKVSYIADIVTPNRVMFTIVPDFNIGEWQKVLGNVEKMDFDTSIFSHSHAKEPFGTMQDITQTREYIEDLQAAIIAEFNQGTAFEDIPGRISLEKYKHWVGYDDLATNERFACNPRHVDGSIPLATRSRLRVRDSPSELDLPPR